MECQLCDLPLQTLPLWAAHHNQTGLSSVSKGCILVQGDVLGFPGGSEGKESACSAGDPGSIPGSRRSPGEGDGNPLQYSCLENSKEEEPGGLLSVESQRVIMTKWLSTEGDVWPLPLDPGGVISKPLECPASWNCLPGSSESPQQCDLENRGFQPF